MTTPQVTSPTLTSLFTCPYCQSPLIIDAKVWQCDGSLNEKNIQHPFDVARQGYVNLLPVQSKKSKEPGDSEASINARHRFLNKGFYAPLQQKISEIVASSESDSAKTDTADAKANTSNWLDIGSGEGYYTQAIADALSSQQSGLIAVDISKPATAQLAKMAKQNQQLWHQNMPTESAKTAIYPLVASASKLPIKEGSITGISTIFSPILPTEFARVLQTGGRLLIAKPDVEHLQSLREALFEDVRAHDSDKFLEELTEQFKLLQTYQVESELALDKEALNDLLTMTPYSYRAKLEKREALLAQTAQGAFKTTARFVVYELVRV